MTRRAMRRPTIDELGPLFAGADVALLGGGPSLVDELDLVPPAALRISLNHHAARYAPCRLALFAEPAAAAIEEARETGAEILSTLEHETDYSLDGRLDRMGSTAFLGLELGILLGAGRLILAGHDLYARGRPYWYSEAFERPPNNLGLAVQLRGWHAAAACRGWLGRPIVAAGGPLVELFGRL